MQYGSEVWGLSEAAQFCENTHLYALKKLLCVDVHTPNDLVYCELNRYPIIVNSMVNCVRYWLRLLCMDDCRLPKKAYYMLKHLDEKGKNTWVTNVRTCLYRNGFGFAWLNQGVGNNGAFLKQFKQTLIDCRRQICNAHVDNSTRFNIYRLFRPLYSLPLYLQLNMDRQYKYIMSKFRFGVSEIAVHHYRYRVFTHEERICTLCKEALEDEIHFVLCCKSLIHLRIVFIAEKFYKNPSAFKMSLLFSSQNETVIKSLCVYLYKAFRFRNAFIA